MRPGCPPTPVFVLTDAKPRLQAHRCWNCASVPVEVEIMPPALHACADPSPKPHLHDYADLSPKRIKSGSKDRIKVPGIKSWHRWRSPTRWGPRWVLEWCRTASALLHHLHRGAPNALTHRHQWRKGNERERENGEEWSTLLCSWERERERRDRDKGPSHGKERRRRGHVANPLPLGFKISHRWPTSCIPKKILGSAWFFLRQLF
jgi:hypothetical protein